MFKVGQLHISLLVGRCQLDVVAIAGIEAYFFQCLDKFLIVSSDRRRGIDITKTDAAVGGIAGPAAFALLV